jgi:hypothetical protein
MGFCKSKLARLILPRRIFDFFDTIGREADYSRCATFSVRRPRAHPNTRLSGLVVNARSVQFRLEGVSIGYFRRLKVISRDSFHGSGRP